MDLILNNDSRPRVLILGGGFGGAYAAQKLSRALPKDWDITVIDRNNFLLFYPLLVEAGTGALEARHVVVPIRAFLKRGNFLMADVQAVDLPNRTAKIQIEGSNEPMTLGYDHLVIACGSSTKLPKVPGLREYAFQLKTLADGIDLRDRGIRLLELANTIADPQQRRDLLRVVIVGANFTGVELAGEYQDFLRLASRSYKNVKADEICVVIVELSDRILGALDPDLARKAHDKLVDRGLDIRTKTSVREIQRESVTLSNGERLATRTTVWAAGIAPAQLLEGIEGLPRNKDGYVECEQDLRVKGQDRVWAVGDTATVLDKSGKPYSATAQNATREGTLCAENILRSIEGKPLKPFTYNPMGYLAAIGQRTAVAKVFGISMSGFFAWFMYRTAYLFKMPGWARKLRIMMDWTSDMFMRAEPVQLGVRRISRPGSTGQQTKQDEAKYSLR